MIARSRWRRLPTGALLLAGMLTATFGWGGAARANSSATPLASLGIARDRILEQGEWRPEFRYSHTRYQDLRKGQRHYHAQELLLAGFTQEPLRLEVDEFEFGLLYGVHQRVTLRAQLPYRRYQMTVRDLQPGGAVYKLRSDGIGDLRLGLIGQFMRKGAESLDLVFDLILPTGRIRVPDDTPLPSGRQRVPFEMRPGSGSWGIEAGFVYQGHLGWIGWGGDITSLFRLDENSLGYREGDRYAASGWLSQQWFPGVVTSQRLSWTRWADVHGADSGVSLANPANDPARQQGERLELGAALSLGRSSGSSPRLAFEFAFPLVESLDGPQLELDWWLRAGCRWAF